MSPLPGDKYEEVYNSKVDVKPLPPITKLQAMANEQTKLATRLMNLPNNNHNRPERTKLKQQIQQLVAKQQAEHAKTRKLG